MNLLSWSSNIRAVPGPKNDGAPCILVWAALPQFCSQPDCRLSKMQHIPRKNKQTTGPCDRIGKEMQTVMWKLSCFVSLGNTERWNEICSLICFEGVKIKFILPSNHGNRSFPAKSLIKFGFEKYFGYVVSIGITLCGKNICQEWKWVPCTQSGVGGFLHAAINPLAEGLKGARAWCRRNQEVQGVLEQGGLEERLLD